MASYGVVVLNYISYEECIECVESFEHFIGMETVNIVIVDNNSPNESYDVLNEHFENDAFVDIIKLETNFGFAKGNNAGVDFLRSKGRYDYFIFSNSDVLIPSDIYSWIKEKDEQTMFDLLGPDVYAEKVGVHQNPIAKYPSRIWELRGKRIKKELDIFISQICLGLNIKRDIFPIEKHGKIERIDKSKVYYNEPLHGSFIIAKERFFDYYDEFFDPRTFLYLEEYFLFERCRRKGLKMVAAMDFQVLHLQGASTKRTDSVMYRKRIARRKNEITSLKIYTDYIRSK